MERRQAVHFWKIFMIALAVALVVGFLAF